MAGAAEATADGPTSEALTSRLDKFLTLIWLGI
jgi:hypothetical protein